MTIQVQWGFLVVQISVDFMVTKPLSGTAAASIRDWRCVAKTTVIFRSTQVFPDPCRLGPPWAYGNDMLRICDVTADKLQGETTTETC